MPLARHTSVLPSLKKEISNKSLGLRHTILSCDGANMQNNSSFMQSDQSHTCSVEDRVNILYTLKKRIQHLAPSITIQIFIHWSLRSLTTMVTQGSRYCSLRSLTTMATQGSRYCSLRSLTTMATQGSRYCWLVMCVLISIPDRQQP